jgi:hypothetical protein
MSITIKTRLEIGADNARYQASTTDVQVPRMGLPDSVTGFHLKRLLRLFVKLLRSFGWKRLLRGFTA